jgi:flagellar basal-body rod protein FlgB
MHEIALQLRARRSELLSSNLANADTPGYKARDIDFRAVLSEYQSQSGQGLQTTHPKHLGNGPLGQGEALYRVPTQPSVDGNTVDTQVEKAQFMENALRYQASLSFIEGRIKALRTAIRGD